VKFGGFVLRKLFIIILGVALLPLVAGFDASDVKVQGNAYLNEDTVLKISVENNSLQDKDFDINFIAPRWVLYDFENVPSEIKASGNREIRLFLSAGPELEGTTYNSTLVVRLGNETVLKEIELHVSKNIPVIQETTPSPTPEEKREKGVLAGFISLVLSPWTESLLTLFLIFIVIVLALIFIAKIVSIEKNKRGW